MAHHVNVFEIEGEGALYVEHHDSTELELISYDNQESNGELMEAIRRTLDAAGVKFSYHFVPAGDESPRSAPFTINQLEDDEYEFETEVFQLAWQEAKDAHDFLATVVEPGTYQVVNRFGHAVGEEVTI